MGSNPALYAELFSDPRYVDLHRAFDQEQPGVRVLEGSQGDYARDQDNLPGGDRRYGA